MSQGVKHTLTEKEERWLRLHFKHTKNAEIAEYLGISETAVHRFARQFGLTKTPVFQKKMQRNAADKAKASHLANGTYPPKGYRIPRSEEHQFQKGVTPLQRLGKRKERIRVERSAAGRKETFKLERARATFGLEQKTKLKVVRHPRYLTLQRNYLRKLGYIVSRGGMTAYYTPETKRSAEYEGRSAQNCKKYVAFAFKPLNETQIGLS